MKQHPGDGDKQEKRTTTDASGGTDISANAMTASTSSTSTSTSSSAKASEGNTKDNNNVQVSTDNNFNAETLKIRLLTGIMYACEVRGMVMCLKHEYHLICDRFWRSEAASARSLGAHLFYYQEQFSIIRDAQFLNRVKRKHLRLQIWQRPKSADTTDNNGNKKPRLEPLGVVFLPLHKFFVAFSNELMANRLVTEKLPVISTDEWVTIRGRKGEKLGEIKCLLAMGSEEQINNLKIARAFRPLHSDMFNSIDINSAQDPLYPNLRMPSEDALAAVNVENKPKSIRRTVELMEMLEETLQQNQAAAISLRTTTTNTTNTNSGSPPTAAENVVEQPMIRLQERNFQFQLYVASAGSLPHNPAAKGKGGRSAAKRMTSKRFPPGESPTTYVTFQADECLGGSGRYKSHEGIVFATNVVERNTHPLWRQHFLVTVGAEYLENPEQNFILKLWKKANVPPGNGGASTSTARLLPKPTDDAIIGFAALDLSVFLIGMHISGTFNVIDFNGRINGQLQLKAKPIDGWYENYLRNKQPQSQQETPSTSASTSTQHSAAGAGAAAAGAAGAAANNAQIASGASIDNVIEQFGKSLDLIHLNLGQAIKHKFNELEGISKRLRTRLGDVTGGPLPEQSNAAGLNDWRPLKEVIVAESTMDDELTEFERDINVTPLDEAVGAELASDIDNLDEFEDDINEGACGVDDGDDEVKVDETFDDNKSDKKEILISKTAPGAADATVE